MRILCFLVALGLLGTLTALAPSARADDAQRAKDLFTEGNRYFDLGQFDKAIDAWQAGYREKSDAVFLYNIAQAYRLAGDLNKAIFFYKGFLRNSPKAHNRPEVEQRIAALQKQLAEQDAAKTARGPGTLPATREPPGAAPPPAASTPPPPSPAASTPAPPSPAASTPPPPSPGSSPSGATTTIDVPATPLPPEAPNPPGVALAPEPEAPAVTRPLDFGIGVGVDGWSSGVQGKANASFALMIAGGYALGHDANAPVRFRIGGSVGYTFLKEAASRETFLSLLVVPTLLIRASARVGFFGELGVGMLGISGLQPTSALLDRTVALKISGTQGLLEIRPALGAQFQFTPGLGVFVTTAVDYSPKTGHFYQAISRTELLIGLSLRR